MNDTNDERFEGAPKWARVGVRVKVKATPILRKYGVHTSEGTESGRGNDNRAWPGEIGTIAEHGSIWLRIEFSRGRRVVLNGAEDWDQFVRVRDEPAK